MSQPGPTPTSSGDSQRDRVVRGAHVKLETRKRFPAPSATTSGQPVTITFEGSEGLEQQLGQVGANEAQLTCRIPHTNGWPDTVLVFLNTPNATADSPTSGGFVGALGLFDDPEHAPHGMKLFRLRLATALKAAPAPAGGVTSATFVPITFRTTTPSTATPTPSPTEHAGPPPGPGQTVSATIQATLELVLSQVEQP